MTKPPSGLILRGLTLSYLGVMVLLPLCALAIQAAEPGVRSFWELLTDPLALHALKLTFATAGAMVVVNIVMGTATAWVLVRYRFPGKGLMNALIDMPFAVPTVVAGLMLVVLFGPQSTLGAILGRYGWTVVYHQPGVVLALLFVTYPFVIRSVQPVLLELDAAEEEAAMTLGAKPWTVFRRVTLPTLWPSILTGAALSFSRALGEFGSVVMIAGNHPMTKTAPLYIFSAIESDERPAAMVVSAVLLACSLGILIVLNLLQKREGKSMAADPIEPRPVASRRGSALGRAFLIAIVVGWFAVLVLVPTAAIARAAFADGVRPLVASLGQTEVAHAFRLTLVTTALATVANTIFGVGFAIVLVRQKFRGKTLVDGLVDLPFAVSPVVAGLMLVVLYGPHGWLGRPLEAAGVQVAYAVPGMVLACLFVTLPFVVREVVPVLHEFGVDQEEVAYTLGAGRWTTFWRVTLPSIRWGLAYGVTLTVARSLGEFGALLVISGNTMNRTQTATLYVHDAIESTEPRGAYAASLVLAGTSFVLLVGMEWVRKRVAKREGKT